MFSPATSEVQASNAPGTWYVWTRGNMMCEGSSVPFQDVMLTVSKAMSTINNCRGTEREKYDTMKQTTANLRRLLTDVYPKWTHRPQWSTAMPDAQQDYVYGLYNYCRAKTSEFLAQSHLNTGKKKVLAACMMNAAHQKLVAAQLLGREDIALEGFKNLSDYHLLYAEHFAQLYDASDTGIGSACAHAAEALKICESANLDTGRSEKALNTYRSRNLVFEIEKLGNPLSLKIIA